MVCNKDCFNCVYPDCIYNGKGDSGRKKGELSEAAKAHKAEYNRQAYWKNREKRLEYQKAYQKAHRAEQNAYMRKRYAERKKKEAKA